MMTLVFLNNIEEQAFFAIGAGRQGVRASRQGVRETRKPRTNYISGACTKKNESGIVLCIMYSNVDIDDNGFLEEMKKLMGKELADSMINSMNKAAQPKPPRKVKPTNGGRNSGKRRPTLQDRPSR